jgi:hypothetical protein
MSRFSQRGLHPRFLLIFLQRKTRRYRGMADIEQASPRSSWLKLPTGLPYLYGEPLPGRATSGQGR